MRASSAPPRRPTEADVALLDKMQQYELAARALYAASRQSIDWVGLDTDELGWAAVIDVFTDAHEAYAAAYSAKLGRLSTNRRDDALFEERSADFTGGIEDALQAMYQLEADLVVTYDDLISQLVGIDGIILTGSIATAEARHGTVLANMAGAGAADTLDELLVSKVGKALPLPAEGN
jgi:hypothetical protein